MGSNGAGKSTTMNIICGVLNQTEGNVWINNINLRENPVEAKKFIGFLPQRPPLYPDMTVEEYLTYCANLRLMEPMEIGKAVEELEISGFSDAELRAYDKFWDSVSVERTLIDDSYQKGKEKGKEEGIAEGMEKGRAEGKHEANTETAQRLLAMGLSAEQVAKATQLSLEIIKNLSNS